MRRTVFAWLLLIAACYRTLGAQTPIPAPAGADSLWQAMRACSQAPVQPGGNLTDVVWMRDSLLQLDRFHNGFGNWLPPDTIVLDNAHVNYQWVIAHELLHQLLRGPPGKDRHPFNPFWFPCKIMPLQRLGDR